VGAAAELMRRVVGEPDAARAKALQGHAYIREHYSPKAIGDLASVRLREISQAARR
jgi:hypothetical protein